jgi:hypothetical protein
MVHIEASMFCKLRVAINSPVVLSAADTPIFPRCSENERFVKRETELAATSTALSDVDKAVEFDEEEARCDVTPGVPGWNDGGGFHESSSGTP